MSGRTGACLCGAVRYRIEGEPVVLYACHCTDCRTVSGAAFNLILVVRPEEIATTEGCARPYDRPGRDGRRKTIFRCPSCLTALWGVRPDGAGVASVYAGTLDDSATLEPTAHIWTRSAQPWISIPAGALSFAEQPPDPHALLSASRQRRPGPEPGMHDQVVALLPRRIGHFLMESGHHGRVWLDLELLFAQPDRVDPLAHALAERLGDMHVTAVCGPLVEGAFVALRVASLLGVPFSYSTPTRERESGLFPVSYPIPGVQQAWLRGVRVAVVNDVINAGSAVRGTLASLEACGARPVAIGALAVYGDAAAQLATAHDARLETLATLPSEIWEPDACPLCAQQLPLERVSG